MKILYDEACLGYHRPGHPERPERVGRTVELLRRQEQLDLDWARPTARGDAEILRVHALAHVRGLVRDADFDADTPAHAGIGQHARTAVAGALDALDSCLDGVPAFSLLRPPGHHARPEQAMGFCYLNQIAVAALEARERNRRVAVFDFDVHHGNGTEDVLRGVADTAFFSIHQFPAYPGTGRESHDNCHNYPMRPDTPRGEYADAFRSALDAMFSWKPDVIALSAGFDAFRGDPLAQENAEPDDYFDIGRAVRESGIPHFALLEGGYSDELPELVLAFLEGLAPDS